MPKQIPCLWFDGQAEQAAQHYTSIFPNSSIGDITRYGPNMPPPMKEGDVMTVDFTLDGQEYTSLNGGPQFPFTEAISFQIMCKDQAEADNYWDRPDRGRRGEPVRLAQGQVRRLVAGRPGRELMSCSTTPTRDARSGPPRRCCRCAASTSPRSSALRTASTPEAGGGAPWSAPVTRGRRH